jgi:hypothetical protein
VRRTRVAGWVATRMMAMRMARPARTIRQLPVDDAAASAIVSVGGGVTRGVPWIASTSPVGWGVPSIGRTSPDGAALGAVLAAWLGASLAAWLGASLAAWLGASLGGVLGAWLGGVLGGVDGGVLGGVDGGVLGGVDGGVLGGVDGGAEGGVEGEPPQGGMLADLVVLELCSTRNELTPARCCDTSSGPNG